MKTKQIITLIAIVAVGIGALVFFNNSKENSIADTETFTWLSNMETGEEETPQLPDMETQLRKRIPVSITFRGIDARNSNFEKVFSTEDICFEKETKEERRKWWKQTGEKELRSLKKEFEAWKVGKTLFRSYAIAVDITEGWNGQFNLGEILDEKDLDWIKRGNDFSIDLYSIGYNEIPGKKTIKKGDIESIEKIAKSFLSQAPKVMPETLLFEQLNHIFKKPYTVVEIATDLMEHKRKGLSAYEYAGEEVDLSEYFQVTDTYPKKVRFRITRSVITGIEAKRQAWYDVCEEQIPKIYPKTVFSFE
ncbi:MAG: hypothetical protein LBD11_01915 [Candidatus Peribacteria bacterium]|jgi:hypothetical protein|nr:hypothetical protein [Candidatus Peribacteria bacterium]